MDCTSGDQDLFFYKIFSIMWATWSVSFNFPLRSKIIRTMVTTKWKERSYLASKQSNKLNSREQEPKRYQDGLLFNKTTHAHSKIIVWSETRSKWEIRLPKTITITSMCTSMQNCRDRKKHNPKVYVLILFLISKR